jgi:hypothetical protein
MNGPIKILIVSANQLRTPYPVYPLGVAYISTYLKEKLPEADLRMFDFNLNNIEEFKAELFSFNPAYEPVSLR